MGYSVPEHFAALNRLGPDHPPPPLVRAGRRALRRDRGRAGSEPRCRSSPLASIARGLRFIAAGEGHARAVSIADAAIGGAARWQLCAAMASAMRPATSWCPSRCSSSCCAPGRSRCSGRWRRLQAVLWTLVPALFYSAPPGQLPVVLAIGHEFQLGTEFGPPLAFWLAEIAFRGAGMFGVYLLSQVCIVVDLLGGAVARPRHRRRRPRRDGGAADGRHRRVLGADAGVRAGDPGRAAVGADAAALLAGGRGSERWLDWLALGLEAGLLLLTTYAGADPDRAAGALCAVDRVGRAPVSTRSGPGSPASSRSWCCFRYLIWLDLSGGAASARRSPTIVGNLRAWARLAGDAARRPCRAWRILIVLGARLRRADRAGRRRRSSRAPVDPAARALRLFLRAGAGRWRWGCSRCSRSRPDNFVGAPLVVLSGLAVDRRGRRPHPDRAPVSDRHGLGRAAGAAAAAAWRWRS